MRDHEVKSIYKRKLLPLGVRGVCTKITETNAKKEKCLNQEKQKLVASVQKFKGENLAKKITLTIKIQGIKDSMGEFDGSGQAYGV